MIAWYIQYIFHGMRHTCNVVHCWLQIVINIYIIWHYMHTYQVCTTKFTIPEDSKTIRHCGRLLHLHSFPWRSQVVLHLCSTKGSYASSHKHQKQKYQSSSYFPKHSEAIYRTLSVKQEIYTGNVSRLIEHIWLCEWSPSKVLRPLYCRETTAEVVPVIMIWEAAVVKQVLWEKLLHQLAWLK